MNEITIKPFSNDYAILNLIELASGVTDDIANRAIVSSKIDSHKQQNDTNRPIIQFVQLIKC